MINLGDEVQDEVTGFKGVAVARTTWLYGCVRVTVQPNKLKKDGGIEDQVTFDEAQLKVLAKKGKKVPASTGGGRESPTRARDPR